MRFLFNDWFLIPLLGISVAVIFYLWADKVIGFLAKKSLGNKPEILKLLKLMGSEVDEKRVTLLMLFLSFGMGVLFFLLFWPNITAGLLFGVAVTIAGFNLPYLLIKGLYERRCTKFVDQMVDGLTIMANSMKTGTSFEQAMSRVTQIIGPPLKQEFQQVITNTQFGQTPENALLDLAERIPKPDVQMFVTAVNILSENGGKMSETFETIVYVIRERQKIEKKIQAQTAQGIFQGVIVTMIPFILAIVFLIIDPGFIAPMFSTTLGLVLCFVMLVLQIIGGVFIKKIVTIKV